MKKGILSIFLSTVLFSTMEIALKAVANQFNAVQITFLRFFIGSIVLLPLAVKGLRRRKVHWKSGDFTFFALTGFICVVVSMVLYQLAIVYSQASVVAVLFSCNPVFVVLFAFLMLHEKIYKHTVLSLIVSLLGLVVIINPLHRTGSALGIALTILSAVTFALYGVVGRRRSETYGGFALTCFSFLFGSLEMLLLILISRMPAVSAFFVHAGLNAFAHVPIWQGITPQTLPSLLYIGVCVTGFGYAFYFLAMEATSAATASLVFFIKPVLAPLLALVILHDPITVNMAVGIVLILAGSLISFIPGFKLRKNRGLREDLEGDLEMAESELASEIEETSIKP